MTQEEKQLLLKDLCARIPYEVQCEIGGLRYGPYTFIGNDVEDLIAGRTFKPYLRPMSSMTKEERKEIENIFLQDTQEIFKDPIEIRASSFYDAAALDWYLKKHFDYRHLIEKGLAIEAPEGMYENE